MVNINKIWRGFKNNLARKVDLLTQNQGEIVDELNKKVDKITSANKVYITSSTGEQGEGAYSKTNATANTFAMRGSDGVLVVGTPTADNHAATKKYVDDIIEANPTATGTETQLERIKIKGTNYNVGGSAGGKLYRHSLMIHMKLYNTSSGSSTSNQYVLYVMYSTSNTPMTEADFAQYLGSMNCTISTYPSVSFPKQGPSFVYIDIIFTYSGKET